MKIISSFLSGWILFAAPLGMGAELTVLGPNGGETLAEGMTYPIVWGPTDTPETISIEFSSNNGGSWDPVGTVANTGVYEWTVPSQPSELCLIRICDGGDPLQCDISDAVFIIYPCQAEIAGDLDHDCYVDLQDISLIAADWLLCANPYDFTCPCMGDYRDCDGNPANGCEVNIRNDPVHCGQCGYVCDLPNVVEGCQEGICTIAGCEEGFDDCDENPANGCEINTLTSLSHCGFCGNVCNLPNAVSVCTGGTCAIESCLGNFRNCDGNPANGCETDIMSSMSHCGACNIACIAPHANMTCSNGVCVITSCQTGYYDCDGIASNGCEAMMTDPFESNNTCSVSYNLGTVAEEQSERSWQAQILPAGDEDWFRFYALEGSHTCFPFADQDYTVRIRLVPPTSPCRDYDLYLYDENCNLLASSAVSGCVQETITYTWDGECGNDDSRNFRVRVAGWGGAWACTNYTLLIDMWQE